MDGRLAVTAARVRRGGRAPGTPAATPALLTAARGPPLRPALAVVAVTVVGVVGVVVTFGVMVTVGVVVSVVAFVTALAAEVLVSAGIAALAATAVVIVITVAVAVAVIAAVVAGRLVCRRAPGVRLRRVRLLGVGPGVGLLGVRLRLVRGGRIRA
ncbi:hypothetical protein [Streptomyces sp. NPDC017435]|uniref:hypothetical protein n=1 Tax=Streptomyces sp. NPDC017435 TaxID=3364995 RepID=UPI003794DE26